MHGNLYEPCVTVGIILYDRNNLRLYTDIYFNAGK